MNINIRHAVESIDNSIYIVEGEDEPNGAAIVEAYQKVNPAIESATISCSKHFPHIENMNMRIYCFMRTTLIKQATWN